VPRISADSLAVVPVYTPEFPPPAHLGEQERVIFRDVVATADRGHFRSEDRELLALYAVHVVTARRLMKRKRRTVEQQRDLRAETALIVSLSTKLRLGPKSRAPDNRRARSAGLRGNVNFKPPWDDAPPAERARPGPTATRWDDTPISATHLPAAPK
jgi:hypothetical protein